MDITSLNEREIDILESIVQEFVLTGTPVGSRTISKKQKLKLSPASIRNVMADLEEKGYLDHPHTSAGRIPTTKGYRLYVDKLIDMIQLSGADQKLIKENIGTFSGDVDLILEKTLQVLARISNQLGVILTPKFDDGVLDRLEMIQVSSEKLMVVLSIRDGIAKTILIEVDHDVPDKILKPLVQVLNERLSGLKIREIKRTFHDRLRDLVGEKTGLIRLFIESADQLFGTPRYSDILYKGTSNIISNPEFSDVKKFSAFIELFEEKNIIVHMMERRTDSPGLSVTIGDENEEKLIRECSIITAPYAIGEVDGVLGVIGPTRMAYNRIIPIVDFTARFITGVFQEK